MRRPLFVTVLVLAWPAAAAEPQPKAVPAPLDPEFLEFLGETKGVDDELVQFMQSRDAQKALKDAEKKASKEDDHE